MSENISSKVTKSLTFCTSNVNKFTEARNILINHGIELQHHKITLPEIQDDDVANVAAFSATYALRDIPGPLLVEDTGLYIDSLQNFPGAYAAFIEHTIGNPGILTLMRNVTDRRAEFRTAIAFAATNYPIHVVVGRVKGTIAENIRQDPQQTGWGYDPIFVPLGHKETYAEMGQERKNACSHRSAAFTLFADWFNNSYLPVNTNPSSTFRIPKH